MEDQQIEVRGAALAVRDSGGSGGTPIVWGHGLSSSMESEDELAPLDWTVAAAGRRVVRYDARGHGASDSTEPPDDYDWDALARDQLALVDALGIDRYVAAGASMGSATALYAALSAPERIRGLVLVIPPTAWETRAAQTDIYVAMADLLDAGDIDTLVAGRAAFPPPDPFADDPGDWNARGEQRLRLADPVRLARVFRGAAITNLPDRDLIRTIAAPSLVLAWTGDPGHPVSTAETLHELLPHSELHLASDADGLAAWSGRVGRFLGRLDA